MTTSDNDLFRRRPWVAVAFAVFLAALLPYLGFAPFDFQKYSTVADHYLYVAMLGPAILIAGILREHRRPAAWSIAAVVLLLLMIRAHLLSYCWRNSTVLFTHTLRVNPRSLAAHNTLGFLLAQQGDLPDAEQHYRAALAVRGWDPAAHFNLANLLAARGDLDQSIAEYRAAAAADPGNATIHNNLGVACARANQLPEAVVSFLNALNLKPDYADAHSNLGVALAAQGRTDEARNHLARALQIDPNNAVAQRGLQRTSATAPVKAGG